MITEKISNGGILSGTINASSNLTMGIGSSNNLVSGNINTFTKEIDPTIPDYIKAISKEDIAGWDNNAVVNEEQNKTLMGLEELIDIITPKNTVKGELVHITDALGLPVFETKVDGAIEQETTTGTNLCDLNVTQNDKVVYNSDGTITINGSGGFTLAFKQFTAKANTKYYIKWELVSGTVDTSKSNGNSFLNPFDNTNIKQDAFKENVIENDKNISGFWINNMAVFTNAVIRIWFSETQIPFEPYTGGQASPNPEYPQEIEVLEAYNLLYNNMETQTINGLEITRNKDGSTTFNGTASADTHLYITHSTTKEKLSLDADDYYISGCPSGGSASTYRIMMYDASWNYISQDAGNGNSFTLNEYKENIIIQLDILKGITFENVVFKPQIVKGKVNKPYLPYGCVVVKTHGKNELDLSKITTTSMQGIDVSYNPLTKKVKFKGTATGTYPSSTRIPMFIPKGTYTFSSVGNVNAFIWLYDKDGGLVTTFNNKTNRTITLSRDAIEVSVGIEDLVVGTTYDLEIGYQLEKGSVATDYEPYKEQIVPLDLKGNWVGKINDNIKDYLVTDKKKFWLVKNIGKVVLDGSEEWAFQNRPNETSCVLSAIINAKSTFYISTHFINGVGNDNKIVILKSNPENVTLYFRLSNEISGVETNDSNDVIKQKMKQWLSENNVEVYYQLVTPEIIELGELPEPIKTFEGTNNIQVLANLDTELEVKYALDLKKYADDRYLELTNALVSTGANL